MLNRLEDSVYRALNPTRPTTPKAIANYTGLSMAEVRSTLTRLAFRGLVTTREGKYLSLPPTR